MLRVIGRSFLTLGVGAVLAGFGVWAYPLLRTAPDDGRKPADTARTTTVYRLPADGWTTFPLPRPVSMVRLLVHADVTPDMAKPDRQDPVRFAVRIQGLGEDGDVRLDRVRHFEARLTFYRDPETPDGGIRPAKLYADARHVPTNSERAILHVPDSAQITRFRLHTARLGAGAAAVNARLYAPQNLTATEATARWTRMRPAQRARLADGNVYPPELLSARERTQLAARKWQRLGPSGIVGRDYTERTMYVRAAEAGTPVTEPLPPPGVRVGPTRRATVRLPEDGTRRRIRFVARDGTEPSGEASVLTYGRDPGEITRRDAAWAGADVSLDRTWHGRLLELRSDTPAYVKLLAPDAPDAADLSPDPAIARVYNADAGPRWRVRHAGDAPTPFRVDLRCACFGPEGHRRKTAGATVSLLDANGNAVKRQQVRLTEPRALYDRIDTPQTDRPVSEPRRLYFRLPPSVASVRVTGARDVVAAAFNRPDGLRRTIRVPEDRFAQPAEALRDRRSWFYLPPTNLGLDASRSTTVTIHARPPEIDPRVAAGDYAWTAYRPASDWRGRRLLVPRDGDDTALRPEALASTYVPLRPDADRSVLIDAEVPRPVQPDLVFADHPTEGRGRVTVRVDGRTVLDRAIHTNSGRLRLPEIDLGRHTVRVETERPARLFMSNVRPGDGPAYRLTLANRLQPGTSRFVYDKTSPDAETISVRLYPALPAADRRTVDVRIGAAAVAAPGPHPDLTLRRRRYDLRIDDKRKFPVLGTSQASVGAARRFVVELGEDLPPGRYPIELTLHGERAAYVTLSTATPGRGETRGVRSGGPTNVR